MCRHQVLLGLTARAFRPHDDHRLPLLVRRINHYELRHAGHFVYLLLHGNAFLQVFEVHRAANLGQDGERVGIPFEQDLVGTNGSALFDQNLRSVHHVVALFFTAFLVHHHNLAIAVHGDHLAVLVARGCDAVVRETHEAVRLRILRRLLGNTGCRTADVERSHGKLRSRFADGLRCDHTDSFTALDQPPGGQITAVARNANAAFRFAGQHGPDLHAFDTRSLNEPGEFLGDFLVHRDNQAPFEVALILERYASHNTVAQRLDDFARFDDGLDKNAFRRAAAVLGHDDIRRNVHQTPRQVSGIGGLQSGIRQTFARAVRGNEVLQHVEAFAEVGGDGSLDDFARGLGHEAAHAGERPDLLF